jgi:hypothetical protein
MSVDLESLRPPNSGDAELCLPSWVPQPSITKRDVHGDVGVVVIFMDWPG